MGHYTNWLISWKKRINLTTDVYGALYSKIVRIETFPHPSYLHSCKLWNFLLGCKHYQFRKFGKKIKTQAQKAARVGSSLNGSCLEKKNISGGKQNKNIQGNLTPDYEICTRNKERKKKERKMLEANEIKVLRKVVGKTKIDRIRSQ